MMHYKEKSLIILPVAGVVFFAIILAILLTDTPPSTVQLAFLGYTNTGAGSEAVFSVRFPPNFGDCGWRPPEVSRKEGAVWKSWSPTNPTPPTMRFFTSPIQLKRSAGALETPFEGKTCAAVSVETTNAVSRIVIQVEDTRRQSRLASAIGVVWGWFITSTNTPGVRIYFITNETSVIPAS